MIFTVMGILLLLGFYGFYFYKIWDQKNKGIRTDYLTDNKKGIVRYIEIAVRATGILVPVVTLLNMIRGNSLFPSALRVIGLIVAAAGLGLFIASALAMSDNWRVGVPVEERTRLVTSGVYAYSRNPAFIGFGFFYIGILFMFFSVALFVLTAGACAALYFQIVNVEEDYLTAAFGEEYVEYKNNVGRFFGKV